MNTANLQLEGLIMAVSALADALVAKGVLSHLEVTAAFGTAEESVERGDRRDLSGANHAATLFPIRVLLLARQASNRGERFTFSEYAEIVGKLT